MPVMLFNCYLSKPRQSLHLSTPRKSLTSIISYTRLNPLVQSFPPFSSITTAMTSSQKREIIAVAVVDNIFPNERVRRGCFHHALRKDRLSASVALPSCGGGGKTAAEYKADALAQFGARTKASLRARAG